MATPAARPGGEGQDGAGHADLRGARGQDPEPLPRQGHRIPPAQPPDRRRAHCDVHRLSVVPRDPPQRAGPLVADRGPQHRRLRRAADQRPRCVHSPAGRAECQADDRPADGRARPLRRDRPRVSHPRQAVVDAVGRRGPADEDGPPPRLEPDRRDLRLRRAHDRPPRPRRPADERAAPAAPGQGQHGPRGRARPGGHPDRGPRRRHGAGCGHPRRAGGVPRAVRGPGGIRHADRTPPRGAADAQGDRSPSARRAPDPECPVAQPTRRLGRRPARRARHGHRGGGIGQELAHPRLPAQNRPAGRADRPVGDPRFAPVEPGDVHRHPRSDPQGLRGGQRGQAGPVQRELRGRLSGLRGPRRDLHGPRVHGRGRLGLRGVRGPPVHRRGPRLPAARQEHRRRLRDVGRGGAGLLRRAPGPDDARSARDRRARLHHAGPDAEHAVGRRAPAAQARGRDVRRRRRLRARRADVRAPHARRRQPHRAARSARGRRPNRDRDRAQPRRRRPGRLGHRPGSWGRP